MDRSGKKPDWILIYMIVVVLIAAIVNIAMYLPIPTLFSLSSGDWLSFWGSYLGGAIGCIPAIAAFRHTQAESKRLHEEATEAQRCSVLPVFSVFVDRNLAAKSPDEYDMFLLISTDKGVSAQPISCKEDYTRYLNDCADKDKWVLCNLMLRNIGLGPALEPHLFFDQDECPNCGTVTFPSLGTEQEILFLMGAPVRTSPRCKIVFSDILGNMYSQQFAIHYDRSANFHSFIPAGSPNPCTPE